jgi:hypothetical protein
MDAKNEYWKHTNISVGDYLPLRIESYQELRGVVNLSCCLANDVDSGAEDERR